LLHWDDLKYVLALEEHGNLIKAATQLKTNPTTVSRHIKRISERYNLTIFARTGNGEWSLTDDGREFSDAAKHCQKIINQLGVGTAQTKAREIKLSSTEFIVANILAPRMSQLAQFGEGLALTLHTSDRNVSLAYGEADIAIRLSRPETGRLIGSKMSNLTMGIYSRNGRNTRDWIGLPAELDWVPEMQLGLEHFGRPPTVRMGSFAAIKCAASECDLACIGPRTMMTGFDDLQQVSGSFVADREVWSVHHESKRNDPALSIVRDWAKSCFLDIEIPELEMQLTA
jgi:DNA-binding transcriptional LysR family regulator